MDSLFRQSAILVVIGIICFAVITILYFINKRRTLKNWGESIMQPDQPTPVQSASHESLTVEGVRQALMPYRFDEPAFVRQFLNLRNRIVLASDMAVFEKAIKETEVLARLVEANTELSKKLQAYNDQMRDVATKPKKIQRDEEIADLTHQEDVAGRKRRIAQLNQPIAEQVPPQPLPKSDNEHIDRFMAQLQTEVQVVKHIEQLELIRESHYRAYEAKYYDNPELQALLKNAVDDFINEFKTKRGW